MAPSPSKECILISVIKKELYTTTELKLLPDLTENHTFQLFRELVFMVFFFTIFSYKIHDYILL